MEQFEQIIAALKNQLESYIDQGWEDIVAHHISKVMSCKHCPFSAGCRKQRGIYCKIRIENKLKERTEI